jgi:predicted transposase YdaD
MFSVSELKRTRVYQEARDGESRLVLRLLSRRIGELSPELQSQIQAFSSPQLEALGEALLDFSQPSDLQDWLRAHA